jgi:RNA polymerase sigma-32 factor
VPKSLAIPLPANLSAEGGLASYIRAINAFPVLSAEEELAMARRYRQHDDLDAARTLVLANLRHVVRIARGFSGYGLPQADLIQEGNIGLMKAVKNFDPTVGVRLLTFAVHWIKAEIFEFALRNWRIVKVATTKAQRKLFFNLRRENARGGRLSQGEVTRIANDLDVPEATVREMEGRLGSPDISFDGHEDDDDEYAPTPAGYLKDMRFNPEVIVAERRGEDARAAQLAAALDTLDARSRDIVRRRWLTDGDKPTLHALAAEYKVSAERIRQIEEKALKQMRGAIAG